MDPISLRRDQGLGDARRRLNRQEATQLSQWLRVIADPTRLQLLSMIDGSPSGEVCVSDMADALGLRAPTISHHLKIMTEAGLLVRAARGRNAWFSIAPERRESVADLLR